MVIAKKEKIVLGLMLCGAVFNAAYAEEYDITGSETWNVPKIQGDDNTQA
ncbi:MAG: hypothetical protein LUF25_03340 [Phascolarctobacterium sp.]|nr:hypothetical protein [Phascolarctobacterium sp.]